MQGENLIKNPDIHITEMQPGADSYLLYRRSSPDNGRQVSNISMRMGGSRVDQEIDNRLVACVLGSFREACFRLGLLEDDNQYHLATEEASVSNSAASLLSQFAVILTWCQGILG